jgi:serine-type D-Ala-D-Ala carboxypeptidase (penicillin-binding protein 5/6)
LTLLSKNKKYSLLNYSLIFGSILTFLILALFFFYAKNFVDVKEPLALSQNESLELDKKLDLLYPERTSLISQLPYEHTQLELDLHAKSAILIDAATGSIIYEKNADEEIPPASMTKLVEMYVVFEAIKSGKFSLDDIVPLPPQSWAVNLPLDASKMFLSQGDNVTLKELLQGLAIASGNDASIAVANYIAGDMDSFVKKMNEEVAKLGLTHTHFVESSGYSEKNITTARDFVQFARHYVAKFPQSLELFHSQKVLRYPQKHNLPVWKQNTEFQTITQSNTNKLIGTLTGCDGLKTGYIDESGYNLAATAKRGKTRFISVTMGGPGANSAEGSYYRSEDGRTLMECAFASFADYIPSDPSKHMFTVCVPGGKENSVKLIPAMDETITVPFVYRNTPYECAQAVYAKAQVPAGILCKTEQGKQYGTISYYVNGIKLKTIPLVADRSVEKGNIFKQFAGSIIYLMLKGFSVK